MMKFSLTIISLLLTLTFYAQDTNLDAKIPIDPAVKIGKLDNGLTYYIRKNAKPENRAEFFLVVNAGAINEDDDQNGLAHFCEHMAFNGTAHFKKHDIINFLQSIGMKFGPEINAFTSYDVTNYMLQKVPTDVKENVDTALLVLYDWASGVSFEDEEIDNERGVIHEEWRTRRGAQFRMGMATDKIVFAGSKYGKRDVIGDIDIIDNHKYETLKRFYRDWYRPDLQAIIAIGDFDVDEMEKLIIAQFSKIPKPVNPKERKYYEIPDHTGVRVAIATDEEARYTNVRVFYKHDVNPDQVSLNALKRSIKSRLLNEMLNQRFEEYTQKPNPPFNMAYGYTSSLRKTKDAFYSIAYAGNNKALSSLEIILTEHKRIKEHGFTKSELDRAKQEVLKWYEKSFKEKDKNESTSYAWKYFNHYLNQSPIPNEEFSYDFAQKIVPEITLEELNELGKKLITEDNMVVVVTGPKNEGISIPNEKEIVNTIEKVKKAKVEAYEDVVIDKPLLSVLPTAGKITEATVNDEFNYTEFKLSNGATVVIKQTDFKEDEILFRAFSWGGSSIYGKEDEISAEIAAGVSGECGLGDFNNIELNKLLSGKIVRLYSQIGELSEELNGSTRPEDFETMLQMVYMHFTNPKIDEEGFNIYLDKQKTWMENKKLDPASAFGDTISMILTNNHPRRRPYTMEILNEGKVDRMKTIYKERFNNAGDFTFVFVGNIDPEKAKPLIEKYIGGLKGESISEMWKDLNINAPKTGVKKVIKNEMKVPKGTVRIVYTGAREYNLKNEVLLDVINDVLDVRYTETVREEQGGTYGVGVYSYLSKYPKEKFDMYIYFDCDPENAEKLIEVVYDEIGKLKKEGPEQKYIDNCVKNKVKEKEENVKKNRFWLNNLRNVYMKYHHNLDDEYLNILQTITIEDVKKAANELFKDNNFEFILLPE